MGVILNNFSGIFLPMQNSLQESVKLTIVITITYSLPNLSLRKFLLIYFFKYQDLCMTDL